MNKKNFKAKFIGPKMKSVHRGHRHYDLTLDKIYDGHIDSWGQFIIYSDDNDEKSYMNRNEFEIIEEHDHIHKCVHTETTPKKSKHYVLIKL